VNSYGKINSIGNKPSQDFSNDNFLHRHPKRHSGSCCPFIPYTQQFFIEITYCVLGNFAEEILFE
jgi:hypothetical protein